MNNFDQEVMARTALGEARGVGQEAMVAVMWTGVNRFMAKRWYSGQSIAGAFLKKEQYSCWLQSDPNYAYITNVSPIPLLVTQALEWAAQVIAGKLEDPTQGATHYFDNSIAPPAWTVGATQTLQIGTLTFYKNVA